MKKIATAWNFLYYSIYIFITSCFYFINKINIFSAFTNTAYFKKAAKKNGIDDFSNYMEDLMNNETSGLNLNLVNSIFNGFSAFLFASVFLMLNIFTYKYFRIKMELLLLLFALPTTMFVNNKIVYNNNVYLKYFNHFSNFDRFKKRRYFMISLVFILLSLLFFFLSMIVYLIVVNYFDSDTQITLR